LPDTDSIAARDSNNPYVFVVGCPRSGTTLLQRMLDNHPELTVANDTHFATRAAKQTLRKDANPPLTAELVSAVKHYRRTYRMGLDDAEITEAARHCDTYAEFVSRLYDLRGSKKGKPLSGEKTPDYCRQMSVLHALFPAARFVHIIRDGRNTTLSTLNWASEAKGPGKWQFWQDDPVATCALWWRWQVGTGQREGRALGSDLYLQLRYEDLVTDPERELSNIARFLHLPYSDEMVNYHAGKTRHEPGLSAKSAWLPPVQGLRDWRREMSEEDVGVFEGIAGDLLRDNSYECLERASDETVSRRVDNGLHWWESENLE
jgi:hypothetical protein